MKIVLLSLLLPVSVRVFAQLEFPACPEPITSLPTACANLCVICNFTGYSGTTVLTPWDPSQTGCTDVNNQQLIGFIANGPFITVTATPSNCVLGQGLKMMIYESCTSGPLDCNMGMTGGGNSQITCNAALTPGESYFILIAGREGDQCDFDITVSPPDIGIASPPDPISGSIQGPSLVCPGATESFTVPAVAQTGGYTWTAPPGWLINGTASPRTIAGHNGNTVQITAGASGSGQICVKSVNACFLNGPTVCLPVSVQIVPPTILPKAVVCNEDVPYVLPWGGLAYNSGQYSGTLDSYIGCDSMVKQQVMVLPQPHDDLGTTNLCEGASMSVCGIDYYNEGTYSASCSSYLGCDSIVDFKIAIVAPVAQIIGNDVFTCGNSSILLNAGPSPSGTFFTWKNLAGLLLSSTSSYTATTPGTYILNATIVTNGLQCAKADTIVITGNTTPPSLTASGGNLTCTTATVQLTAASNGANPVWSWEGPGGFTSASANPVVSTPGAYTVTVTTAGGAACTASTTLSVLNDTAIPPLSTSGATITCSDTSVQITAGSSAAASGFAWSGPNGFNSTLQTPAVTSPGDYIVVMTGSINGCTAIDTAVVGLNVTQPGVSASGGTVNCAAPGITLTGNSPANTVNYGWTGPNGFNTTLQNPTVSDTGVYLLTVTDTINGCTSVTTVNVLSDKIPPVAFSTTDTLTCTNNSVMLNGNATLPSTFTWTGPNAFFSNLQNPTVSAAGDYTLTATAANGCTGSVTITVAQNITPPVAMVSGDTIHCINPQVQISAVSPQAISYAWTGPNGFSSSIQNPTVSLDGFYTVTVAASNGCTSTGTAAVGLDVAAPVLQAAAPNTLTCALTSTAIQTTITTTSALQTLLWSGPGGFIAIVEDPAVTTAGIYTLTVTTANGCSATTQVTVNQDTLAPDISVQDVTLTCTDTSINLNGISTTPGAAFAWNGPNGFSASQANPAVAESGTYTLTVTGLNGCVVTAEALVALDNLPPVGSVAPVNELNCADLITILTASSQTNGVSYMWSGPNNFSADTAITAVADPGIYQVIITGLNGCFSIDTVTVIQDIALPGVSAAGDTIDCISGQAFLTGASPSPGATFAWTGPNNFISTQQNPAVSQSGTYTLTATGANHCNSTTTVEVDENTQSPFVTLSGGATLTCAIQEVTITGMISTPGATGIWTGPGSFVSFQPDITVAVPGIYTYTVTGLNACISAPAFTVSANTELPQGVTATGGLLDCNFPGIHLEGTCANPGVGYAWTGPNNFMSILPDPEVSVPGEYILVVTNPANGCSSSATAQVTQDPTVPDISVEFDSLSCLVQTILLDATTNTPGANFAWTGPNGFTSVLQDPAVTLPGAYSVVVTAPNGCSATLAITLAQDVNLPTVSAQGGTLTCTLLTLQLSGNSTTPGAIFAWTGPGGFTSGIANPTVTMSGDYILVVTGVNGCSTAATAAVISDTDTPVIHATGGILTCLTTGIDLLATSDVSVIWQWNGPGSFQSSLQNPGVTVPGNYTVVATASNGCSAISSAPVTENTEVPVISIAPPDQLDCNTQQTSLHVDAQGTGTFTYQWTTPDGLILSGANTPNPQVGEAGSYQVAVTGNANGCSSTQMVNVEEESPPAAVLLAKHNISCFGEQDGGVAIDSVQGGTPSFVYSIDNHAFASDTIYNALGPGNHTLTVQDANGCEFQTIFDLPEPPALTVDLGPDTTIHLGEAVLISLNSIVNHPDRVEQILVTPQGLPLDSLFIPGQTLDYKVTVLDSNGCSASDDRIIRVDRTRRIYIPNIFNPNSTQFPVLYIFSGPEVVEIEWFQIYDRWGNRIFEQLNFQPNDPEFGWTGRYGGKELPPGVFVYQAMVRFIDGGQELFKGGVTLLR